MSVVNLGNGAPKKKTAKKKAPAMKSKGMKGGGKVSNMKSKGYRRGGKVSK
tara:strand:- start:3415 stop:3567 length:153 start_codon:yes stop_codon:yes gene_type:complete